VKKFGGEASAVTKEGLRFARTGFTAHACRRAQVRLGASASPRANSSRDRIGARRNGHSAREDRLRFGIHNVKEPVMLRCLAASRETESAADLRA
jgi:hypothetical protein